MALVTCPDCGREVSDAAQNCPQCGRPLRGGGSLIDTDVHGRGEGMFMKSMNCGCVVVLAIIVLIVVIVIFGPMMATTR